MLACGNKSHIHTKHTQTHRFLPACRARTPAENHLRRVPCVVLSGCRPRPHPRRPTGKSEAGAAAAAAPPARPVEHRQLQHSHFDCVESKAIAILDASKRRCHLAALSCHPLRRLPGNGFGDCVRDEGAAGLREDPLGRRQARVDRKWSLQGVAVQRWQERSRGGAVGRVPTWWGWRGSTTMLLRL